VSVAFEIRRLARGLGIVAIFSFVGPLAVTAVFACLVLVVGIPILDTLLQIVELKMLQNWLSAAVFLLIFFAFASAMIPSILAGVVFAIVSVYCGLTSVWAALMIAGVLVLGIIVLGFFVSPSESSPLLLPGVKGVQQGAFLALFLSIPAAIAAYLSWFFSRPLHRSP
jgi:hypothetical protein